MNQHHYEIALQAYMAFYGDNPEINFAELRPDCQRQWYRAARAVCGVVASALEHVPMMSTRDRMSVGEWQREVMERYL